MQKQGGSALPCNFAFFHQCDLFEHEQNSEALLQLYDEERKTIQKVSSSREASSSNGRQRLLLLACGQSHRGRH